MIRSALLGVHHPHALVRAEILRADPRVRLLGFVEDDDHLAESFEGATGVPRIGTPDILIGLQPDLVVIEAPDPLVPELARQVAGCARALLLEKPGAGSLDDLGALMADLSTVPVAVHVGYELHYSAVVAAVRRIFRDGALGEVTLARFHCAAPTGCGAEQWQSIPGNRGGTLFTIGSHLMELVVATLGLPTAVAAIVTRLPESGPVTSTTFKSTMFGVDGPSTHRIGTLVHEDAAAAVLQFPSLLATFDMTAWEGADWLDTWSMDFVGTRGVLHVEPNPALVELVLHGQHPVRIVAAPHEEHDPAVRSMVPDPTYLAEMDSILRALERGDAPDQSGLRTAHEVMRLLEALYRASEERRVVALGEVGTASGGGSIHG